MNNLVEFKGFVEEGILFIMASGRKIDGVMDTWVLLVGLLVLLSIPTGLMGRIFDWLTGKGGK